jgi:lysophospholipase L1-like esterase
MVRMARAKAGICYAIAEEASMAVTLSQGATILLTGDSITDCGRRAHQYGPLGRGYAFFLSSWVTAKFPELGISFINTGLSGDRVADLARRWSRDAIALRPSLVSILVGVNDTWRRFDSGETTTTRQFADAYRRILEETKRETNAIVAMCEPFLLPCGLVTDDWREDMNPKIGVVRELAREFAAVLVPLSDIFAAAAGRAPPEYWAEDGVHPTPAGHALIAQAWIKHVLDIG